MNIQHEQGVPSFRPFSITLTIESETELRSLRALFGGIDVDEVIGNSATPNAPRAESHRVVGRLAELLNNACDTAGVRWFDDEEPTTI